MNKLLTLLSVLCMAIATFAANGDTTTVRVFDKFHMNRYGNFDQKVAMPSAQKTQQRAWLKYTLGCLSNGQCEWDYTLKLFVREHTGKNDSTLQQAPYLKVGGTAKDSISYAMDTTWVNVYNGTSKRTDSVPAALVKITLFGDTLNPLILTDSITGFAANYWRVNFDTLGRRVDSVWVPATHVIRQKFTPYYRVFEVVNDIELGRFISPYAKTFPKTFQYDYIYDVTDYMGLMHDSTEFRIQYQGYSYGFTATWDMIMVEGTPARDVIKVENIYNGGFNYGQATSIEAALIPKTFVVPANASAVKARVIITGHGGENSENCAEFCAKYMYVKLNTNQVAQQLVWKDDCGDNAIIAQPGTWVYDRANWCPGEKIRNYDYNLNVTASSTNTIDLDMEEFTASGAASYNIALQLIYYKNNNREVDGAIEEILAPTRNFWHNRTNPICDNAKFLLKNWGATPLTTAEISYQIGGAPVTKVGWHGNLAYEKEEIVTIPYLQWPNTLGDSTFKVWLSKINGVDTDDNISNNMQSSKFDVPFTLPSTFVIETRTNAAPAQNSYTLTDAAGNVLRTRTFPTANTLYRDTFNLQWGCYTFRFNDEAGNGMGWWAATSEGNGTIRILNATSPIKLYKSYNTDFGNFVQLNFRVQYALGTNEQLIDEQTVAVYPNPATDQISIEGFEVKSAVLMDVTGKQIQTYLAGNTLQLNQVPTGIYLLQLVNQHQQKVIKKVAIAQ
jgi:hypothetical protein